MHRLRHALLLAAALSLAACSGPRETAGPTIGPEVARDDRPTYETFDPATHQAPVRVRPVAAVEHDVPPRLMEGRVDVPEEPAGGEAAPQPRTVQGFRIQVFSGEDRAAAERVRGEAETWARSAGAAAAGLRAEVAYLQPYYRVRLGAFAEREEAEAALAAVRRRYAEAFLVPDLVTVLE